jgi:hypothetical protein
MKSLASQEETLNTIEDTLEAQENILTKSMRTLRSMEWLGSISNKLDFNTGTKPNNQNQIIQSVKSNALGTETDSNDGVGNTSSDSIGLDQDLELIAQAIEQLHEIGTTMNLYLIANQGKMKDINHKTSKINDMTLATILKSSRILGSYVKDHACTLGYFQFVEVSSGKFLSVENYYLTLSDVSSNSTHFECEIKKTNLIGIKNSRTLKYIGTTLLGNIKVSGDYWGQLEECFIDLSGEPTGILVLARNWGSGGLD